MAEPYQLLHLARRSGVVDGPTFPTYRRTRWTVELTLAELDSGGSVSVRLEAAPVGGDEDEYVTRHDFGSLSSTQELTVRSFAIGEGSADFTWNAYDQDMRAIVYASTGEYVLEVRGTSPFLDPDVEDHEELLPTDVRQATSTRDRLVERAERMVVSALQRGHDTRYGALALRAVDQKRTGELVREAVAAQAGYLQLLESLRTSQEAEERREWRRRKRLSPEVWEILHPVLRYDQLTMRGR